MVVLTTGTYSNACCASWLHRLQHSLWASQCERAVATYLWLWSAAQGWWQGSPAESCGEVQSILHPLTLPVKLLGYVSSTLVQVASRTYTMRQWARKLHRLCWCEQCILLRGLFDVAHFLPPLRFAVALCLHPHAGRLHTAGLSHQHLRS